MNSDMPFIVSVGQFDEPKLAAAAEAISKFWGGKLQKVSCEQEPNEFIHSSTSGNGLVHILGDPAMFCFSSGSWLESLGAWNKKIILLSMPLPSGDISGMACAYFSLSKELSVETIGLFQVGGIFNTNKRKLDGLPWTGLIKDKIIDGTEDSNSIDYLEFEYMINKIKKKTVPN